MQLYSSVVVEGNLEVKLLTIWEDEAVEVGRVREEKKKHIKEEKVSKERRSKCVTLRFSNGLRPWTVEK